MTGALRRPACRQGELVRAVAAGGQLRVVSAVTTPVVEEARRRHDLWPTAAAALGRLMTAAVLLASSLKDDERIMLQVVGDGPLRHLVAEAGAKLQVRAYAAEPHVHLPLNGEGKLDVAKAMGRGILHVIRDLGLKEPYRGAVPLVSGEIARDVAHYLARSEQTPSSVALGVLVAPNGSVRAAGGFAIFPLPGAAPGLIDELEHRLAGAPSVSRAVDALGPVADPVQVVAPLLSGLDLQVLDRGAVEFHCPCSRRRFEAGLVALGPDELRAIAAEQDPVELRCRFCNRRYLFSSRRLLELAAQAARRKLRVVEGKREQ